MQRNNDLVATLRRGLRRIVRTDSFEEWAIFPADTLFNSPEVPHTRIMIRHFSSTEGDYNNGGEITLLTKSTTDINRENFIDVLTWLQSFLGLDGACYASHYYKVEDFEEEFFLAANTGENPFQYDE